MAHGEKMETPHGSSAAPASATISGTGPMQGASPMPLPVPAISGYERRILADCVPGPETHPEVAYRIVGMRREIVARVYAIKINAGQILRHQAQVEQCEGRLKKEGPKLPQYAVKDIVGRLRRAQAEAAQCREMNGQMQMEIRAFLASGSDRPRTWWVRLRRWLSLKLWV